MKLPLLGLVFALVMPLAACGDSTPPKSSPSTKSTPTESPSSPKSSANSPTGSGYTYNSKDGNYTVVFPAKPSEQNQTANSAKGPIPFVLAIYTDDSKQRAFLTSSSNLPLPEGKKPSDYNPEKGLDGARDGASKSAKATIVKETKITQNGYPGREITMKGGKNTAILQRIFIDPKGPTLYQAVVVAADGNLEFPEAKAFIDSLSIK